MRKWIDKLLKIIHRNEGETVVESIVSLLVLSILLLAAAAMIQTALKMTVIATQNAKEMQEDTMNPVIWSDYDESANYSDSTNGNITFFAYKADDPEKTELFSVNNPVEFNQTGGVIAFSPPKEWEVD